MSTFTRLFLRTSPKASRVPASDVAQVEHDSVNGGIRIIHASGDINFLGGNARTGTPVASVKAVKTLTGDGTNIAGAAILTSDNTAPADGETVTIGTKVYTFKTALTPTEGQVLIGASADAALLNLIRAINHTGTPNTNYKCAAAHPTHYADAAVTAHTISVRATTRTAATDALALAESSAHLSWNRSTTQALVVIGDRTYTFCVFKASNTLTQSTGNVSNDDKVVIGTKTYTFQTTLTNTDGNVKIGATAALSMTNLFNAINATGGTPGTDYASNMTANTQVTATNPTATTVVVTAKANGQASNSIATTETAANLAWSSATLGGAGATAIATGGTIAGDVAISTTAALTLTNLYLAIDASGTAGINHADDTPNAVWLATNPSGTTVVITARAGGLAATSISTTETSTALSWANTTAGVDGTVANKGDMLLDGTYLYIAASDLTTGHLTGWRKIAHSAL